MSKDLNLETMTIAELKESIISLVEGIFRETDLNNPKWKIIESEDKEKAQEELKRKLLELRYDKFKRLQAFFVHGAPGIGKSDAFKQMVIELMKRLKIKFAFRDIRLTTLDPVDLRGVPMVDRENMIARWLQAGFLPQEDEPNGILLIDEINAVPPAIQAAAYQLTLDKEIGEYKLPPGWIVVCAGNRLGDKAVTYRLPSALANRFTHIELVVNNTQWIEWAMRNDIDSFVINFIRSGLNSASAKRHDSLFGFDPDSNDIAFPSPRSWEFVSNLQYLRDTNFTLYSALIKGTVGKKVGNLFSQFLMHRDELPNPEDILQGIPFELPQSYDTLYVMISMLNEAIKRNPTVERIDNYILNFVRQLEDTNKIDIVTLAIKDMTRVLGDEHKDKFLSSKEAMDFINTHINFEDII